MTLKQRSGRVPAISRLLPAPLRDPVLRRPLLGWLGVGLAVRFAVMPFAFHSDLLAVYWRAHLIAYEGQLFGSYLVNMGAHYVHALALRLLGPLLPPPAAVWTDPWWWGDSGGLQTQVTREFATSSDVFSTLFVLKLPYLAFDLAAGLLLLSLVAAGRPQAIRRAWAFWMLSPIGLYATYLFARYEAFPVALVLGALLACERRRPWTGALLLGLAVTTRTYPLLLVPVFALVAVRGWRRQGAWAGLALLPFALTMVTNRILGGTAGELARLRDIAPGDAFLALTLPVQGAGDIYLMLAAVLAVYGYLLGRSAGWWGAGAVRVGELWVWLLVVHAAFFALATFSAHYFMWFTPFVALALARRPRWRGVLALHLLQVVTILAISDLVNGPRTVLGLFQPLSPVAATELPSLRELLLNSRALTEQLIGVLRTGFLVLTGLLAAPALAELAGRAPQVAHPEPHRPADQHEPQSRKQRVAR
ncbi:MAG TPA: glycosyltransferase family 87 protein [Egibacteraceae bacterium]|nr:glycosyltransferase family 87 protein [Egibacteraceae bacterium]